MQSPIEKLKQNLERAGLFENALFSLYLNGDDGERKPAMTPQRMMWLRESIKVQILIMQCLITIEKSSEFREFITRLETRTPQLTETASEKSPMQSNSMFPAPKKEPVEAQNLNEHEIAARIKAWLCSDDDMHPYNFNVKGLVSEDSFETTDETTTGWWAPGS